LENVAFFSTFFAPSRVVIRGITTVAFEAKNELFQSRRCLLRSLRYLDRGLLQQLLKSSHSFFFRNMNGITEKWVFVYRWWRRPENRCRTMLHLFFFHLFCSVRSASFARLFTSQTLVIFPLQERNMHEIGAALAFTK